MTDIVLHDPKHLSNVAAVLRNASAFGVERLIVTGRRAYSQFTAEDGRLPRELRMRDYKDVQLIWTDRPFDLKRPNTTVLAVEYGINAQPLPTYPHPINPMYVFGPEDGGLGRVTLQHCHNVLTIPTKHCLNLAVATGIVLYSKMQEDAQVWPCETP